MERTKSVGGVFGQWTMTITLGTLPDQEPEIRLDEPTADRALRSFSSLDRIFFDLVCLAEAVTLEDLDD